MNKVIGLDLGKKTCGIAYSDALGFVHGIETYRFKAFDYEDAAKHVDAIAKEKYNAGLIVKKVAGVLGGSGGGRPDIASGAGKDASKVNEALGAIDE